VRVVGESELVSADPLERGGYAKRAVPSLGGQPGQDGNDSLGAKHGSKRALLCGDAPKDLADCGWQGRERQPSVLSNVFVAKPHFTGGILIQVRGGIWNAHAW
jgi:hypothetical protein